MTSRPASHGLTFDQAFQAYQANLFDQAAVLCNRLLQRDRRSIDALHLLGTIRLRQERATEALNLLQRASAIGPQVASIRLRIASAARQLGQLALAQQSYEATIALDPSLFDAWNGLGITLAQQGRAQQALQAFERALAIAPQHARANWNMSLVRLAMGDYAQGWLQYEWRRKIPEFQPHEPCPYALWLGQEDLVGKTILLCAEQGLGDSLQFCRYAPLLLALGANVIMRVPSSLAQLLGSLHPRIQFQQEGVTLGPVDFYCPLMSLPLAFKTLLQSVPSSPYLHADPLQSQRWAHQMGERAGLRVGLVWAGAAPGNAMPEEKRTNQRRSLSLSLFEALGAIEGIDYFSLQLGEPSAELAQLGERADWHGPRLRDLTSGIRHFADTAALVSNLDLVIGCDTSVIHLAGAMGKPVWVLSRFDGCWRWLLERSDSPWYPSARIFRQRQAGDWSTPLAEVAQALAQFQQATAHGWC